MFLTSFVVFSYIRLRCNLRTSTDFHYCTKILLTSNEKRLVKKLQYAPEKIMLFDARDVYTT